MLFQETHAIIEGIYKTVGQTLHILEHFRCKTKLYVVLCHFLTKAVGNISDIQQKQEF